MGVVSETRLIFCTKPGRVLLLMQIKAMTGLASKNSSAT
jgi:hypothetical protein